MSVAKREEQDRKENTELRQSSELLCFPRNHSDSMEDVLPCSGDLYKNPITFQNLSEPICLRLCQVRL